MIAFLERIQERFFNRFWNPFIVLVFAGVFAAFYFALPVHFGRLPVNLPAGWKFPSVIWRRYCQLGLFQCH